MAKSKRSGDAVGNAIENSLKLHQKGYWAKPVAAYKAEYVCVCCPFTLETIRGLKYPKLIKKCL